MKCTKHQHKSREAALAHLRSLIRIDETPRNPYFCSLCRAWHIWPSQEKRAPE